MRTITEIEREILEINTAISQILQGGQSWEITSASGAGTKRVVTMADYNTLLAEKKELLAELAEAQGQRSRSVRPGW